MDLDHLTPSDREQNRKERKKVVPFSLFTAKRGGVCFNWNNKISINLYITSERMGALDHLSNIFDCSTGSSKLKQLQVRTKFFYVLFDITFDLLVSFEWLINILLHYHSIIQFVSVR